MISSYIEYGLLAVVIFVTVKATLLEFKKAKTDSKFKQFRNSQNQFLILRPRVIPQVNLPVPEE